MYWEHVQYADFYHFFMQNSTSSDEVLDADLVTSGPKLIWFPTFVFVLFASSVAFKAFQGCFKVMMYPLQLNFFMWCLGIL